MNSIIIKEEQEFRVYGDILQGRLQPFKPQFNDRDLLSGLIEYANTREVVIKVTDLDLNKDLDTIEFSKLGYRDKDDFSANIRSGEKPGTAIITIVPISHYLLGDKMDNDIEQPPCFKSKCYLRLIIDEFERIKIRACKLLNTPQDPEQLKFIALKNLRTAEFLLRESSAVSHFLFVPEDDTQKRSLYYITVCLKKFLIKSIRFYHKLFDPLITEFFEQSENLIKNIDCITNSDCIKYLYPDELDNNLKEQTENYFRYPINPNRGKDDFLNILKSNPAPISKIKFKQNGTPVLRWTGKINLLITLFYDLMENGQITSSDGKHIKENSNISDMFKNTDTNMKLVEFLYDNFLDNSGQRLSKNTLRTYLNPNRPDKRSKRSQNLNLDKYK
ncbi:MAG: hypothetical protein KKG99_09800 [Bacteroidetes bacterium]|nr:hypothetical protein [Bacteroidota bacterium]